MASIRNTESYTGSYPYRMTVKSAGRRLAHDVAVRGSHHGSLPVVAEAEAPVVFRIAKAGPDNVSVELREWEGHLWAPMMLSGNRPVDMPLFGENLRGENAGVAGVLAQRNCYRFDPFSSPYLWQASREFKEHGPSAVSVGKLPQGVPVTARILSSGADAASARAHRVAERLAMIGDVVHFRVPAPMWHVTTPAAGAPRYGLDQDATATLEWTMSPTPLSLKLGQKHAFVDGRVDQVLATPEGGCFVSWQRERDIRAHFEKKVRVMDRIEVLDRDLAERLTVAGEDQAVSASYILPQLLRQSAENNEGMSDDAVDAWMALRRVVGRMGDRLSGPSEHAVPGFRAAQVLFDDAMRLKLKGDTGAMHFVSVSRAFQLRWKAFGEDTVAPSLSLPGMGS